MLIRCDKCTTLYELDEALLPPHGAPVQCSKCQYVFTAYPPLAPAPAPEPSVRPVTGSPPDDAPPPEEPPEDEPVPADLMPGGSPGVDDAPAAARDAPPAHGPAATGGAAADPEEAGPAPASLLRDAVAPEPSPGEPPAGLEGEGGLVSPPRATPHPGAPSRSRTPRQGASPRSSPRDDAGSRRPQFTADGRPIRKVPFPAEEPQPPRDLPGLKPPKGGVRVDAGRRRTGWVLVAAVLVVLALVFAGWRLLGRRSDGAAASRPVGAAEPSHAIDRTLAVEPPGAGPPATSSGADRAGESERRARGKILPTTASPHPGRNAPKT